MPPNSTQNLNAKLSLSQPVSKRVGGAGPGIRPLSPPPASGTRIFGGASSYRGGYHLSL